MSFWWVFKDRNHAAALVEKEKKKNQPKNRLNACAHFLAVCPKTAGSREGGKIPQSFLNHGGGCSAPNSLDVRQHEATQFWGSRLILELFSYVILILFLKGFSLPSVPYSPGALSSLFIWQCHVRPTKHPYLALRSFRRHFWLVRFILYILLCF